jgi:hypothetical protein
VSTSFEHIEAQKQAVSFQPQQLWQKHLLPPDELRTLFSTLETSLAAKKIYRDILHFLINNEVPKSRCEN